MYHKSKPVASKVEQALSDSLSLSRPQSLPAQDTLMSLRVALVAAAIVYVTMFDSMFIGPVPVWFLLPLLNIAAIIYFPQLTPEFRDVCRRLEWRVIVPWIVFLCVASIMLFEREQLIAAFSRRIIFVAIQLLMLLTVAALAMSIPPRRIIHIIAVIAIIQGVVSVGQILQMSWARKVPDLFFSLGGKAGTEAQDADPWQMIKDISRARGTLKFVHKFNPMQGMLAAFLLTLLLAGGKRVAARMNVNWLLLVAGAIIGVIGMLMTFSRSTILGIGLTLAVVGWRVYLGRGRAAQFIFFGVSIVSVTSLVLFLTLPQVSRLLSADPYDAENLSRTKQTIYTFKVLQEAPIFGAPMKILPGEYPIHSVLFREFTDFGIVGALPYFLVVMGLATFAFHYARANEATLRTIAMATLGIILVAIADSWTHSGGLMHTDVAQVVLIGMGIGMILGRERKLLQSIPAATG